MQEFIIGLYRFAGNHQLLLGIPLGVVTAYVTLWVSHNLTAPRLEFSEDVRRTTPRNRNPLYLYAIKIRNHRRRRLIDVSIRCRLAVFDVAETGSSIWTYYNMDLSSNIIQAFGRGLRIIHINANSIGESQYFYLLSEDIKEAVKRNRLRIEDIFLRYKRVNLRLFIVGHDEFTGVKKIYASPSYRLYNIDRGKWRWLELVRTTQHNDL